LFEISITGLYIFSGCSILLALAFFPKFPWLIHSTRNIILFKLFSVVLIGLIILFIWTNLIQLFTNEEVFLITNICVVLLFILYAFISMFYLLVWSIPSYHEWKRNPKVRVTAKRYIKPKQGNLPKEDIGEVGSWLPRLIVGDTPYYLIDYCIRGVIVKGARPRSYVFGYLALDMDGNIIRDQELVHTLLRCRELAYRSSPQRGMDRSREYDHFSTVKKTTEKYMRKFEAIREEMTRIAPDLLKDVEKVLHAFEIIHDGAVMQLQIFTEEAKFSAAHGGTSMRECRYEDVLVMAAKIRDILAPTPGQQKPFIAGINARKRINEAFREMGSSKPKDLQLILNSIRLNAVDHINMFKSYQVPAFDDEYVPIYFGFTDEDLRVWKERLEYVDMIDQKK